MKRFEFKDWIIVETPDYLVINKPSGISSLDERHGPTISIQQLAKKYTPTAILCHRLDRDTTGALLIAKSEEAYRHFSMQFEHRKVLKNYLAIVNGTHAFDNKEVFLPIGAARNGTMRIDYKDGKEALTYFNSEQYYKHFTLVRCTPITGRTHQIRVHLASQNASIAGDTLYGSETPYLSKIKRKFKHSATEDENPIIHRFALHAHELQFLDLQEQVVVVKAPLPKDFAVFVKLLDKYDM